MVYQGTSVRERSAAVQGLVKVAVNETGGSELENHQEIGRSSPHLNSKVERGSAPRWRKFWSEGGLKRSLPDELVEWQTF